MTTKTKTAEQIDRALNDLKTTSAKIRFLDSQGLSRGAIAKRLGIRYQWVRNVLIQPVSKPKEQI